MKLPSLSFLLQAFFDVALRFPSTMLCAFTGVGAVMSAIESNGNDNMIKLWLMAQLGLALCTGLTVLAESLGWNRIRSWSLQLLGLALLVLYYFLLDMDSPTMASIDLPRYLGFLIIAHLLVAVAPYLNRRPVADFWEYNKRLFANFVVGAVYTTILYSGLALALLAVNELFNLGISEKMYAHLFILLAGLFQTAFFLYHLPAGFAFEDRDRAYNVVFRNLCQYILIPIVGLYFLILYAYSAKILVTWNLPRGWVSSLVLGFSVAGIFTYLINYLLPESSDNKLVLAYRKWFWWVLLPMTVLLFVAIGRRIADYGITENRFYVAHTGVWLLVMCVYFLWSKTDNIKFIPISLILFLIVTDLGPFNVFYLARRSQTGILQELLEKDGRFQEGKLKKGGAPVSEEDAARIRSCLVFLGHRDALKDLEPWFSVPLDSIVRDTNKYGQYNRANEIMDWLELAPAGQKYSARHFIDVYQKTPHIMSGSIAGYRSFYRLDLNGIKMAKMTKWQTIPVDYTDNGTGLLLFNTEGKVAIDSFDLSTHLRRWKIEAGSNGYYAMPDGAEVLQLQGKKSKGLLYVQDARFDADSLRMERLSGLLFVR